MSSVATSRQGVPIRLSDERWDHIVEEHGELTGLRDDVMFTISNAEAVFAGSAGELFAVRIVEQGKALTVIYRESSPQNGFVITAFLTRRLHYLYRRPQVWPPPN